MITSNVINRVFYIAFGNNRGSGFTICVDNKEYLVTAKHLVEGIKSGNKISIWSNNDWTFEEATLIGHATDSADVSVLQISKQLTAKEFHLDVSHEGLILSQDVYFLGFPYSLTGDFIIGDQGYPVPHIKKAIVSQLNRKKVHLDGFSNPGFSGGPMVFQNQNYPQKNLQIGAIITSTKTLTQPVIDCNNAETSLTYQENTGIIVACSIGYALDIISANPNGTSIIK